MSYYQAFVVPVKTAHLQEYRELAERTGAIWKKLGALAVIEAAGEGLEMGKVTSFPRAVLLEPDETVVWSFLRFRDRAHCDEVMAAGMQNEALMQSLDVPWIDGKRMVWGIFGGLVEL